MAKKEINMSINDKVEKTFDDFIDEYTDVYDINSVEEIYVEDFKDDENDELLNNNTEQYFYFLLNETIYAIPALKVTEVIEYQKVTRTPLLNPCIYGVTNVRNSIIVVLDLSYRFKEREAEIDKKTSFVIVNTVFDGVSYEIALLVDEIYEVDGCDENTIAQVPSFGTNIDTRFISKVAKYNDKEIYILDIDILLNIDELSTLKNDISNQDDSIYKRNVETKTDIEDDEFVKELLEEFGIDHFASNDDENEDEIDISTLISSNTNDTNQYLVFEGVQGQLYGKNVSKIEELIVLKDVSIQKNYDDSIIMGNMDLRDELLPLINFDRWLGLKDIDDSLYHEIIVVNIGQHKFGIVVRETKQILTIESNTMNKCSDTDLKSTFIAKILLDGDKKLCNIVDSDKMIIDIFSNELEKIEDDLDDIDTTVTTNKKILFADDSSMIRNSLKKIAKIIKAKYSVYENGELLYDGLKELNPDDISLIVTDLEMPKLDGKGLISKIREDSKYDDIDIVVYTNMANSILEQELLSLGASLVVPKIDIEHLSQAILNHVR